MNKKGLMLLLLMFVLTLTFAMSGCINSQAEPFVLETGITIFPYYNDEGCGASVIIYSERDFSGNGDSDSAKKIDSFLFDVLSREFKTSRQEGYPQTSGSTEEAAYGVFGYDIKIDAKEWFFNRDPEPKIEEGFFSVKVSFNYSNPFAECFEFGTKFNAIYNYLTQDADAFDYLQQNFDLISLGALNTTVIMGGRYTMKAETGGIMFETESNSHIYKFSAPLSFAGTSRLKYSYTAIQGYGWFTVAIIIGLLTVVITLLAAKKMSGRVVDAKRRKAVQPTVEFIFDPFDGGGTGGQSGGTDSSGGGQNGQNGQGGTGGQNGQGGQGGGTSGQGGVFDGF